MRETREKREKLKYHKVLEARELMECQRAGYERAPKKTNHYRKCNIFDKKTIREHVHLLVPGVMRYTSTWYDTTLGLGTNWLAQPVQIPHA